jgi:hypothetical protein
MNAVGKKKSGTNRKEKSDYVPLEKSHGALIELSCFKVGRAEMSAPLPTVG